VQEGLTAVGLISVVSAGPGTAGYEVADKQHDHFVCRICGAIRDVPGTVALDGRCLDTNVGRAEDTTLSFAGRAPIARLGTLRCVRRFPEVSRSVLATIDV
jgi:Fe2+ or Zn2+ uptake regulation protein